MATRFAGNVQEPARVLEDEERRRFASDGYLAVTRPVLPAEELAEARDHALALLRRGAELPSPMVRDLAVGGDGGHILEVNWASEVEPKLRHLPLVRRCRRLAQELLGARPALAFDHVIHKPAGNRSATPWHQDAAFAPTVQVAVHLWVPFDEVGADDSCMQFVPGSHRHRWVHRPRGGNPEAHALEAVDVDTSAAVRCPVPLGGLTAHQPGTLHHTGPNEGRRDRTAWIMQFRPDGLWRVRAVLDRRHR